MKCSKVLLIYSALAIIFIRRLALILILLLPTVDATLENI